MPHNAKPVLFFTTRCGVANGASLDAVRLAESFTAQNIPAQCWALYSTDPQIQDGVARCFWPAPPQGLVEWGTMLTHAITALWRVNPRAIFGFNPLANVLGCTVAWLRGCKARIGTQRNPTHSQTAVLKWLDLLCGSIGIYTDNIFISPDVVRSYKNYPSAYKNRITMIWNGAVHRISQLDTAGARAAFGLPGNAPLLGTVGRLAAQKNQQFLLDVLPLVPHLHLAIAGDGELEAELKAKAVANGVANRVHFIGPVAGNKVPDFLRALDIFVFPSAYEGFGIALIEAMQQGLPCVTSDLENFKDILMNTKGEACGYTLPFDTAMWATTLQKLQNDSALRTHIGQMAIARAADFSFTAMSDGHRQLLAKRVAL